MYEELVLVSERGASARQADAEQSPASLRLVFYALSGTTYGREVVPVRVRVAL